MRSAVFLTENSFQNEFLQPLDQALRSSAPNRKTAEQFSSNVFKSSSTLREQVPLLEIKEPDGSWSGASVFNRSRN